MRMTDKRESLALARDFLSPDEVARVLGCSPKTVRVMVKRGEFKGRKLLGRWYIPCAEVQRAQAREESRAR